MMTVCRVIVAGLFVWMVMVTGVADAQIVYGEKMSLSGQMTFQNWTLKTSGYETRLSQFAFPISCFAPVAPHWEIHFNSALNRSRLAVGSTNTSVMAMSPSTLRVFRSFAQDRLFAAAGLVIPTGKTQLAKAEVALAELISIEYLDAPIKQLGGGAGLLLQVGGASQYQWLLYGGSVAYSYTGAYKYLKDGSDYNPGDEFSVQASGSTTQGDGTVDLDVAYKYYTADETGGKEIFKAGGVVSLILTGKYNFPKTSVALSIAEVVRSKNSLQFGNSLRTEDKKTHGNKTILSGSAAYILSPQVSVSFSTEYRLLSENGYDTTSVLHFGKSDLFSFGGGVGYSGPDDKYSLFARLGLSTGAANRGSSEAEKISIVGTEISLGGRIRF
jgi:hypothetical protein